MHGKNEMKKAFLKQYQECLRIEKSIEDEIRELRESVMIPAPAMDGMPHGREKSDLSNYITKVWELFDKYIEEKKHSWKIRRSIVETINALRKENERSVTRYRYINNWSWNRIAKEMHYSEQYVKNIHGDALNDLVLPEWFKKNKKM